ncbi:hypothetical protein J2S09_005051 [Bacillus fengqiuensis]|nr:hypothetical protein [Bacillus fengqiuensis]
MIHEACLNCGQDLSEPMDLEFSYYPVLCIQCYEKMGEDEVELIIQSHSL